MTTGEMMALRFCALTSFDDAGFRPKACKPAASRSVFCRVCDQLHSVSA